MTAPDLFADVRKQAQRALEAVLGEIRRREAELRKLIDQAEQWRAAISGATPPKGGAGGRGRKATAKGGARKRSGGKRVDWDVVLEGLPKTFGIDDVMKRPGVKARGRPQVYPALARWMDAKKVKRVGQGQYQKL